MVRGAKPPGEASRTAAEQYLICEKIKVDTISIIEDAIPKNIERGDFALAASNYAGLAEEHAELGLLHWRHGLDPRSDFERAVVAYDKASALSREHQTPKNDAEIPVVYAMLSLMGRRASIEFEDSAYHKEHRWPCYQCCLVHALHDQPLDAYHDQLLNTYLGVNDELADSIFRTYFALLESKQGESQNNLVAEAETNWIRRKTNRFFGGVGPFHDGYGLMNDLHVDIYLAAVLHKIGWVGDSEHRWRW